MLRGCSELEAQKKDPVPIPEAQKRHPVQRHILTEPVGILPSRVRKKNSNPPNIYLIFEVKHVDHKYGYSIQWGIFEQDMSIFSNV